MGYNETMNLQLLPLKELWPEIEKVIGEYAEFDFSKSEYIEQPNVCYFVNDALLKAEDHLTRWGYQIECKIIVLAATEDHIHYNERTEADLHIAFLYLRDVLTEEVFYPFKSAKISFTDACDLFIGGPEHIQSIPQDKNKTLMELRADLTGNYPENAKHLDERFHGLKTWLDQQTLKNSTVKVHSHGRSRRL